MSKLQRLIGFVVVCGWLSGTDTVHADAVTDWHAIAVQALATMAPPRAVPLTFLDIAIVQAAVHEYLITGYAVSIDFSAYIFLLQRHAFCGRDGLTRLEETAS